MKGVYIAEDSIRHYPFGSYLSHVLGFAGIDNQGLLGLEAFYDKELKGEKGYVKFYSDAKGKRMPGEADDYTPPKDGLDMKLTIDSKVQTIMEREFDIAEAKYNPDGMVGVAMNPKTGRYWRWSAGRTLTPQTTNQSILKSIIGTCLYGAHMSPVRLLKSSRLPQLWKRTKSISKRSLL